MRFLQIKNNILSMLRRPFNKYYGGLTGYTSKYFFSRPERLTVINYLERDSNKKAAEFLKSIMPIPVIRNKRKMFDYICSLLPEKSNFYEFGTWTGGSLRYFLNKRPDLNSYSFDTFEGLPFDWKGSSEVKGTFNLYGKAKHLPKSTTVVKGLFSETMPIFFGNHIIDKFVFIHIDCDIYESTTEIFALFPWNKINEAHILFDEFHGYIGWEYGEKKAFDEWLSESDFKVEYLAFSDKQMYLRVYK